jgi:hypothetical protein
MNDMRAAGPALPGSAIHSRGALSFRPRQPESHRVLQQAHGDHDPGGVQSKAVPLSSFSIAISLPAGAIVHLVAIYLIRAIDPDEWRLVRHGLLSRVLPNRAA